MTPNTGGSSSAAMAADKLESKELAKLLEIIDKLREFGVSEDISLPQLVVVGDQSSGKSSLLEALTNIRFPVASTLCTRFATQISFRKSVDEKITVSIIPSKSSDDDRKKKLRSFSDTVEALTSEKFAEIMDKAAELMGLIRPGDSSSSGERFSDDVLRIELCGPSRSHFSVVDVPGLFQSATAYQTESDLVVVENLAKSYIEDSRTIILAVASSLNETANQKVFRLAKAADPKGIRTVGVLTKPDAIQPGDEGRVIDIAMNKVTVLNHGWFVVRNRSTEEVQRNISNQDRQTNESRFFEKDPWRTLDRNRVGIPALEKFLQKLLFDHVRKEYPGLVLEIDSLMDKCRKDLEELGPRRETSDEQRRILIEIATEFQMSAKNSLMGFYEMDCLKQKTLRVRMHIQNLNEEFSTNVWKFGHTKPFKDDLPLPSDENAPVDPEDEDASIYEWIKKAYRESRGTELPGMINPGVVQLLFQMQTENWEGLAVNHITSVKKHVEDFVIDLLRHKCPDNSLRQKILMKLRPMFAAVYKRADDELAAILKDERGGILITYNHYYSENLASARNDRVLAAMKGLEGQEKNSAYNSAIAMIKKTHISNEQQAINEIYDVLKAFYKVARKRFVDCVALQVIERHYLGPSGPVRVFSPSFVGGLTPEELRAIAGEDQTVVEKRKNLTSKLERLQGAQEIANTGYW